LGYYQGAHPPPSGHFRGNGPEAGGGVSALNVRNVLMPPRPARRTTHYPPDTRRHARRASPCTCTVHRAAG
jgi:hypothetical protein